MLNETSNKFCIVGFRFSSQREAWDFGEGREAKQLGKPEQTLSKVSMPLEERQIRQPS